MTIVNACLRDSSGGSPTAVLWETGLSDAERRVLPRLLVPISTPHALAALAPEYARLRAGCDRLDLLGCYVHSAPTAGGRLAARMFAPSIGVPEDIANANSTACLAARLAERGVSRITVDMGDSLSRPASIIATTRSDGRIRVGGAAKVIETVSIPNGELA